MVLGLKPMGKPTTLKENTEFWTPPGRCMAYGLYPMGGLLVDNWVNPLTEWKSQSILESSIPKELMRIYWSLVQPYLNPRIGDQVLSKYSQSSSLLGNPLGWFILGFSFSNDYLTCIIEHPAVVSVSLISLIPYLLVLLYLIVSISSD